MASRSHLGLLPTAAPKKKTITYGKSTRRIPSTIALAGRTTAASDQLLAARLGDEDATHRGTSAEKSRKFPDDSHPGPGGARTLQAAKAPAVKRKPSQGYHSENRPIKKQRSTSPNSSPSQPPPGSGPSVAKATLAATYVPATLPHDTFIKDRAATSTSSSSAIVKPSNTLIAGIQQPLPRQHTKPPSKPTAAAARTKDRLNIAPVERKEDAPAKPRRRLIDALAMQAEDSSAEELDEEEEEEEEGDKADKRPRRQSQSQSQNQTPPSQAFATLSHSSPVPISSPLSRTAAPSRPTALTKKPGVRFTYAQQRTVVAETLVDLAISADHPLLSQSLFPESQSSQGALSFDEDDDSSATTGAIRSVHELRQAGANNRFADELDDMLDRVGVPNPGKPSSTRRGALLELAHKLHNREFLRQFQNHSDGTSLFRKAVEENDIIAGFALGCILATLLTTSTSHHLLQQVQAQGISHVLALLLANDVDITVISKERKNNVSKHGQTLLSGARSAVLKFAAWKAPQAAPSRLSPRTLALKCLELAVQNSRSPADLDELFSPAVTGRLFAILSSASQSADSAPWYFPSEVEAIDLYLALSVLEVHCVSAILSGSRSDWAGQYVPIAVDILETVLRRRGDQVGDLECLVLRLAINTTNNNPDAQTAFIGRGLVQDLVDLACTRFDAVLRSIDDDSLAPAALDSLLLTLGVMINFSEHNASAYGAMVQTRGVSPLDRLIQIFRDNHTTTAEVSTWVQKKDPRKCLPRSLTPCQADTDAKTQINVAFGYLSVLLGYLCLWRPIKEGFGNLAPLLKAIREFIAVNIAADHATRADGQPSSSTGGLQSLVNQLESAY